MPIVIIPNLMARSESHFQPFPNSIKQFPVKRSRRDCCRWKAEINFLSARTNMSNV